MSLLLLLGGNNVIRGLGDEKAWWCPSLDTANVGTATLRDFSGNGKTGTLTNMTPSSDWVLSDSKYCLDFDGTNDQVLAAEAISVSANVGISLWANVAAASKGAFIKIGGSSGVGIGVGNGTLDANGLILTLAHEGVAWLNTGYSFTVDTWTHIAFTKTAANAGEVFVNGVSVITTGSIAIASAGDVTTYIGGYSAPLDRFCTAKLDDIRLFDRVLTGAEITALSTTRGYRT